MPSMTFCALFLSLLVSGTVATMDEIPLVEVSLEPSSRYMANVRHIIEEIGHKRVLAKEDRVRALAVTVKDSYAAAAKRIRQLTQSISDEWRANGTDKNIARTASFSDNRMFVGKPIFNITLNAFPFENMDSAVVDKIEAIGRKDLQEETAVFSQAAKDLKDITDVVLKELAACLLFKLRSFFSPRRISKIKPVGFLEQTGSAAEAPQMVNVRVTNSVHGFPTVATLVQALELDNDTGISKDEQQILKLMTDSLMFHNSVIEQSLKQIVGNLKGQMGK